MKSLLKNLSLLSMGLLIYSCNEKISAELQDGNSTTVPTVVAPSEYYFKVTNNSPTILNYVLHRTGPGRYGTNKWNCEVSSTGIALSSTLFVGESTLPHQDTNKNYDISCFFEAEELAMAFNGLSFNIEASKNTCDYIGYAPYSFLDAIPGRTSAAWRGITCEEGINSGDAQTQVNVTGWDPNMLPAPGLRALGCGEMVDISISVPNERHIIPIPEEHQYLCKFDYKTVGGGNGENCDVGQMTYNFTNVYDSNPDPVVTTVASRPNPKSPHACGGSITSCVGGAIKQEPTLANNAYGVVIHETNLNQNFSTTKTLPKFMTRGKSVDITNFRRGLASLNLDYQDYTTGNEGLWGNATFNKEYDPFLVEKYSMNQNPDSSPIVDLTGMAPIYTVDNATFVAKAREDGYTATPLAADPFLGYGGARVNPLYTFYCLDTAMEVKARIRMAVRDWDRVFPSTTTDLELISDVYKPLSGRRQDMPNGEPEIPTDPSPVNVYNDFDDWDAFVEMTRADPNLVGVYDPGDTTWEPSLGWWNPAIFPSLGPAGNQN